MAGSRTCVLFSGVSLLQLDTHDHVAVGVVDLLATRGVPVVLCSGRTRAELEYIQHRLGIAHPFICEHGEAAVVRNGYFPDRLLNGCRALGEYAVREFGRPYTEVEQAVRRAAGKARAPIVRLSEMSIAEVASAWGVPPLRARLAKLRDYEEGFRVVGNDCEARTRMWRQLQSAQLACVSDGVFDFAGSPVDLAVGTLWLAALFRRANGPTLTIGLGDRVEHAPLLRHVDVPFIVPGEAVATRQLFDAVPHATVGTHARSRIVDLLVAVLERQSCFAVSSPVTEST